MLRKIYTYLVSLGTAIVDVSFTFPIYVPVVVVDFWHVTQVHSRGFRIQQRPLVWNVLVEPNQRGSLEHPLNLTLPEFNIAAIAPENRPTPKRKGSSSNHPFSGAFDVSFREGIVVVKGGVPTRGWGFSLHVSLRFPPTHRWRMDILKDSPLRIPDGTNSSGGANVCGCRTVERTDLGKTPGHEVFWFRR